ncbi:tetratricopeptide repeat protein [Acidovorax soli]|uniref:Tetratricopeptide repeat-containing protein n=1 Tax=Acidovorax soli TaxID=592050 RepID=A0A1H4CH00_9BURK|nr:tetratricopeptide repeat protein [Acidovorax soli]SEA59583.1 Tetratricopeptide repeat-containing protein [Acidovorax soli]
MDYYDPMVPSHRFRTALLTAALLATATTGWTQSGGQPSSADVAPPHIPSAQLDAELFYEIFLGELTTQSGDPGAGYSLMLEAARRSGDSALYRRAADIALQARSGDYALAAARAWKEAQPQSREANRYTLQILIALNRIGETPELLRQELAQMPAASKAEALSALPQMYGRASDKSLAANVVERALTDELLHPATGPAAWTALGRMRLAAGNKASALDAARQALTLDGANTVAMPLVLELMEEGVTEAELLVTTHLAKHPDPDLRTAYARVLLGQQRYPAARQQLETVTRDKPDLREAWLALATLQFQDNRLRNAEKSLQRYMELTNAATSDPDLQRRGLTQAYLLSAQIAEKNKDYAAAESWLGRIENSEEMLSAQRRRASLLAQQGKLPQARALLRGLPGNTPSHARMKLQAEVQLLQEMRLYKEALAVQVELVAQDPEDNELVYDQAMLAEKSGDPAMMEQLLRQLIERKPDYHHAYNALGYSLAERGLRLEEAKGLISKALEYAPGDPFITDSLGWVEFRLGNSAEALRLLSIAFKARPDAEIAAHLGEVLWSTGNRAQASSVWREGLRLNPDNETLKDTLKRLGAMP